MINLIPLPHNVGGFVFKGWSKRYFCLFNDGQMVYKSTQSSSKAKKEWNVKSHCESLRVGQQCTQIAPRPETGANILHIFTLTINRKNHFFQADSEEQVM